ncbi:MAG: hypothetical protein AMXMBFR36_39300 [Acidobacteriota bacterium]
MRSSICLAPLVIPSVYLLLDIIDQRGFSEESFPFLLLVGGVCYPYYVVAGLLAAWAQSRSLLKSRVGLVVAGAFAGALLAVLADLPSLNLLRWRYYAAAVAAGGVWAFVLSVISGWSRNDTLQGAHQVRL